MWADYPRTDNTVLPSSPASISPKSWPQEGPTRTQSWGVWCGRAAYVLGYYGDEGTGLGDHSLGGTVTTGRGTSPEGLVCVYRFPSALEGDKGAGLGELMLGQR